MKNLEIKNEIKKMSLANIEGKLTPEEMENIMAGSGFCQRQGGESFGNCFSREVSEFCDGFVSAVAFSTNPSISVLIAAACSC